MVPQGWSVRCRPARSRKLRERFGSFSTRNAPALGLPVGCRSFLVTWLENRDYHDPVPAAEPKITPGPKSLEDIGPDVERKFNLEGEGLRGRASAEDFERFRAAFENLVKLEKEARGNVFQRMVRRHDPAPTEEIEAAANQVWDALEALHIALTMNPDSPQEASLWPDMVLIERYIRR